jgi:hypothetical protein
MEGKLAANGRGNLGKKMAVIENRNSKHSQESSNSDNSSLCFLSSDPSQAHEK